MAIPARTATFTITELRRTGSNTLVPRAVEFVWDSATRSSPSAFPVSLRVATSREEHPGSDEPVEQVISVATQPFTFEGKWDDKWGGAGFAERTRRRFAELVKRAPLVRIVWGPLRYTGLITNFEFAWEHDSLVRYAITISPHTDTVPSARRLLAPPTAKPTASHIDTADALRGAAEAAQTSAQTLPFVDDSFAQVQQPISGWKDELDVLAEVDRAFGVVEDAAEQLRSQGSRFRRLMGHADTLLARAGGIRSDVQIAFGDAIAVLDVEVWSRDLRAGALQMVFAASEAEADMLRRAESRPARLYRPHAGENVYHVANQVYGTPGLWRQIVQANGLSKTRFDGTEELVIPEVAA